jgi:hypothetical protein
MAKVIILNQATIDPQYSILDALSRTTWGLYKHPEVQIIHYYGAYDTNNSIVTGFPKVPARGEVELFSDGRMLVGANDTLGNYFDPRGEKMMLAFEYCLKNLEFDFILRICNTSYIDVPKVHEHLSSIRKERIYDGTRNMHNNEIYFVTGFNSFLSRDVVEKVVEHKEQFLAIPYLEDLALGKLIMHDLALTSFEDQPHKETHVWAFDDTFDPGHYVNSSIFNYRFRSHTSEKFIAFHEWITEYRKNNV